MENSGASAQVLRFAAQINAQLASEIMNINSSIQAVKTFFIEYYNKVKDQTPAKDFLESLTHLFSNYKTVTIIVIFLDVITGVNIGTKLERADCIKEVLMKRVSTDLVTDDIFWVYLERVLLWTVGHCLQKTAASILLPFEQIVTRTHRAQNSNNRMGSDENTDIIIQLRLLKFFTVNFPAVVLNNSEAAKNIFMKEILSVSKEVHDVGLETLEHVMQNTLLTEKIGPGLCAKLCQIIESNVQTLPGLMEPVCEAAKLLLDVNPRLIDSFNLKRPPYQNLSHKEISIRKAAFAALPLYCRCAPETLTQDIRVAILKTYEPLVKKKTINRNDAMMSLGKYIFARGGSFEAYEEKYLKKIRKNCEEGIDCDSAVYCLAALITATETSYESASNDLFALTLSLTLTEACKRMSEIQPSARAFLCGKIQNMCLAKLLNMTNPASEVIMAFKCMDIMHIPFEDFSVDLVIQLSAWMSDFDPRVREISSKFVLGYHREKPTIDVFQRVLSVVSTEIDEEHRIYLITNVKKKPCDERIIPILESLINDPCGYVRNKSLKLLAKLAHIQESGDILAGFIADRVRDLGQKTGSVKEQVNALSIIATTAFNNKDEDGDNSSHTRQLMIPFAQFLVKNLLEARISSTNAVILLRQVLPLAPKAADVSQLASLINSCLSVHSSSKRLNAASDLLQVALDVTDLKFTIYNKNCDIMTKLLELAKVLSSEQSRVKYLKLLGSIGAISPSMITEMQNKGESNEEKYTAPSTPNIYITEFDTKTLTDEPNAQPRLHAICNASVGVSLLKLLDILAEESLSGLHSEAIDAFLAILKAHRGRINEDLEEELFKRLSHMITSSGTSTSSALMKDMSTLISVLGERFAQLIPHFMKLVSKKWNVSDKTYLARILNSMIVYLPDQFAQYASVVANLLVNSFNTSDVSTVINIFNTLDIRGYLPQIDHILLPALCEWLCEHAGNGEMEAFLPRVREIFVYTNIKRFAGQIIRTLICLVNANAKLKPKVLDILLVVAVQMKTQFLLYFHHVRKWMGEDIERDPLLSSVVFCLETWGDLRKVSEKVLANTAPVPLHREDAERNQKLDVITNDESSQFTAELPDPSFEEGQWHQWFEKLFETLVNKCIPYKAISKCDSLAQRYAGIRNTLFPMAFTLCYFNTRIQSNLAEVLNCVFKAENVPRQILRLFLDLVELIEVTKFVPANAPAKESTLMLTKNKQAERDDVDLELVAKRAAEAESIAHALRANEELYTRKERLHSDQSKEVQQLIVYNQQLGLPLAAHGVLVLASNRNVVTDKGMLAEKLGLWEDALKTYSEEVEQTPSNMNAHEGKLRSLRSLSLYEELQKSSQKAKSPIYEAAAFWGLRDDEKFLSTVEQFDENQNVHSVYFKALYYVMKGKQDNEKENFAEAERLTSVLRSMYTGKIFPTISEDYDRIYTDFASVSLANEIEEVVCYLRFGKQLESSNPDARFSARNGMQRIMKMWKLRFTRLAERPDIMYEILRIRSLALTSNDLMTEWIGFLNSSISDKRLELAKNTLDFIRSDGHSSLDIEFCNAKLDWARGEREQAIDRLGRIFASRRHEDLAGAELTLGRWLMEEDKLEESYIHIFNATNSNNKNPLVWKAWCDINTILYDKSGGKDYLADSLEASINGLALATDDPLSFTLRILSTVFRRGDSAIYERFRSRIADIPVQVWIPVLPQIIARANSKDSELHELIQDLIYLVGREHPQAVLYSLLPPLQSDSEERKKVASTIFEQLRTLYPAIIAQINTFSNELIRSAVTWWELWRNVIDEGSRAYVQRNDREEMVSLISPAHKIVKRTPETMYETMFMREFGSRIEQADKWITEWKETHEDYCIFQAWNLYTQIFHGTKDCIKEISSIPLADASPVLEAMYDMQIVVPGTYVFNEEPVYIKKIDPVMTVMNSKQRPRKMAVTGSNGMNYTFLLKAHEDTRLDERVMQFFALLNTLMSHSQIPLKEKMGITVYKVIPLTGDVGLIGWVPDCHTIYDIMKIHREKNNVPMEIEYHTTMTKYPNYDTLKLAEKQKAFEEGVQATDGMDLKHMLFLRAEDSGHWVERRTQYTTSLAMTSMAGYILGLGDRHMCNIMIKRKSAKLVHIDFGDCFEVAMKRDRFPETVPFRLTRVLQNALEISGIDGTFKTCCLNIMELMHVNSDQIMGLLEVFIYDPLLQWIETDRSETKSEAVFNRIKSKLDGRDLEPDKVYEVPDQVSRLIEEATSHANLCRMFRGWFPWW